MITIPAKTILTKRQDLSWFSMDYNMNIYKGCCHGCIYCDSRSDCYQIQDFDMVRAKENALTIIRDELSRKTKTGVIGTGAMSDPYNPYEEKYQLSRQALKLIDDYHFGIAIATKSNLIARDVDILQRISRHSPVLCKITVTAAEDALSKMLEPGVCESSKRFEAAKQLSEAGVFTGILMTPILPYINDTVQNVLEIVHKAHISGAKFIYALFGVTLRFGQREYFYHKLDQLFPDQHLKELYMKTFGNSYLCHNPKNKELYHIFAEECNKYGILYKMEDIIRAYRYSYNYEQLSLFH